MNNRNWFILKQICCFISCLELGTVLSIDEAYETCQLPGNCGRGPNISYPFWVDGVQNSSCGSPGFGISCKDRQPIITLSGDEYIILDIVYKQQYLDIRKNRSSNEICSPLPYRVDFNQFLFSFAPNSVNLSLFFNCTAPLSSEYLNYSFGCPADTPGNRFLALLGNDSKLEYVNQSGQCASHEVIHVDVFGNGDLDALAPKDFIDHFWEAGFHLRWNAVKCDECSESGGSCGFNFTTNKFMCFCPDRPHQRSCDGHGLPNETQDDKKDKKGKKIAKIAIGLGVGFGSILLTCIGFVIYQRLKRKRASSSSGLISRDLSRDSSLKPDPEKGGLFFETKLFTYKELDEATNHFDSNKELGDGGFGTVYHGKLRDGRVVAVKRLFEHNYKRVEQFMNEIEILSRLRHQNLVSLYGCTSRHSRELLLVYEFVPNGTVADHLHGERVEEGLLTWPIRMSIAIQSADALAYLHASEIIHRDVKSNNILLDNNFHVKVADFGLSRLFPTDVTHVSTAPQGTPGYVDPEYYQCYQLTNKSDVYSFGVVLIELISSKPAVDIGRHRHEINLANMAVNRIHSQALHELVDPSLGYDTDYSVRNMITLVAELAFRCLQQENEMRPCMTEVLEILRGIEKEEYKKRKTDDMDTSAVARLLKTSEPLSPDTVTGKWPSKNTTPNTSG